MSITPKFAKVVVGIEVIVVLATVVHPLASVTEQVYEPAIKLDTVAEVAPKGDQA